MAANNVGEVSGRIEEMESRSTSKGGEYVSLTLKQESGATLWVSAFDGASIDDGVVVLPAVAGGDSRHAKGDVVTLRVNIGAYVNKQGRAYPSYTLRGSVSEA
jgi:hypothetical protein